MGVLLELADRGDWQGAYKFAHERPGYKSRALAFALLATHPEMAGGVCSQLAVAYAQLHLAEVMEEKL